MADANARHRAPSRLELVRCFLNTWEIANDTREPHDLLPALIRDSRRFKRMFGVSAPRTRSEREQLVALRAALRGFLSPAGADTTTLNDWLSRLPVTPHIVDGRVAHHPIRRSLAGLVLAAFVDAVADDGWYRLKACDDCQYVFYDHTRNSSRRWCMMGVEGPGGRSCGSIAKVRRYRERIRADAAQ